MTPVTVAVAKLAAQIHGGRPKVVRKKPQVMDHLVLLLSGTPMPSRPKELVSQLKILGRLEQVFGSRQQFLDRYATSLSAPPFALKKSKGKVKCC